MNFKISVVILLLFQLINAGICYVCDLTPRLVPLDNGIETGIVSQSSTCYNQGFTIVAQNNDESQNIKIQFTIVPSNFQINVYDGKLDSGFLQNCQIQNGSICYSTGSTVTFYFIPIDAYGGYNNRVELTVTPNVDNFVWDWTTTAPNTNGAVKGIFSVLTTLIFCAFYLIF